MPTLTATPSIVETAHALLQTHPTLGAAHRIRWARSAAERNAEWGDLEFDGSGTARIERDGFSIHVEYSDEDYPDESFLGTYTDEWEPGAIKNLAGWDVSDAGEYTEPDGRHYQWFIPSYSAEEARGYYRKAGYSRHVAWLTAQQQVRQDMDRRNEITLMLLKVTVFRAGIELAADYLGGIDLGHDLPNVDSDEQAVIMAIDSIGSAVADAKAAMKAIAMEFTKNATI